ncbi:MAG: amidohydrolase family protein [Planctomycetaceae bacterium]|nr:amidohydrolase family protein [Planctomycetaceae bacterium]
MIIDIHSHVYVGTRVNFYPYSPFMSAKQCIEIMDKLGIDKSVILPLNNAETPCEPQSFGEIMEIMQRYPGRFIPFCCPDPRLPINPEKGDVDCYVNLLGKYKALGCKGVGELTARIPWDNPLMQFYLAACQLLELPVIFHTTTVDSNSYGLIDEIGLPKLEAVLKKFPKLKMIGHSAAFWSEISGDIKGLAEKNGYPAGKVVDGGAIPRLLRQCSNLFVDISAGSGLNALKRDEDFAYKFIEEFQDRIMFGLDICNAAQIPPHLDWLKNAKAGSHISEIAYEKIIWKNANRILNLELE